ncbi:transcriptional regulator [Campylobacterota bacterium]|nr:transcriptional regulator [Campylobacterota bacterium]
MNHFDEVLNRIRDVISHEVNGRVRDQDVAQALGLKAGNLATLKSRDRLPIDEIALFCAKRRISINWMLFDQSAASLVENTEKYSFVRYFSEAKLSAGGGAFDLGEEYEVAQLPSLIANALGITDGEVDIVAVEGDSMEPTLSNGDLMAISRKEQKIKDGGIYALATPHGLFIKRVQREASGFISLMSDNPDYEPIRIGADEARIIGVAIGAIKKV